VPDAAGQHPLKSFDQLPIRSPEQDLNTPLHRTHQWVRSNVSCDETGKPLPRLPTLADHVQQAIKKYPRNQADLRFSPACCQKNTPAEHFRF
jgi:hypothetical protein